MDSSYVYAVHITSVGFLVVVVVLLLLLLIVKLWLATCSSRLPPFILQCEHSTTDFGLAKNVYTQPRQLMCLAVLLNAASELHAGCHRHREHRRRQRYAVRSGGDCIQVTALRILLRGFQRFLGRTSSCTRTNTLVWLE